MYNIIRFYADGSNEHLMGGFTLEEARAHCSSPESSEKKNRNGDI